MKNTRKENCLNGLSKLFSIIKTFVVNRFNGKHFREDFRKMGIVLIGAGIIGIIIESDTITAPEALTMFILGFIIWIIGLSKSRGEKL